MDESDIRALLETLSLNQIHIVENMIHKLLKEEGKEN